MGRTIPYNHCDKCLVFKSLTGTYKIDDIEYDYRVCPRCYPARINVENMIRKLHIQDKKNKRKIDRGIREGLKG